MDVIETSKNRHRLWSELKGFPRASALLIGYAIEMYLKAGLISAYRQCPQDFFSAALKRVYRHDLSGLAEEVEWLSPGRNGEQLQLLQDFIMEMARYPIHMIGKGRLGKGEVRGSFTDRTNARTDLIWDNVKFLEFCKIAKQIRAHVMHIDHNEDNMCSIINGKIGETGFWVFRRGGGLRPRLTYKLCAKSPEFDFSSLKALVETKPIFYALHCWDECRIVFHEKL